MRRVLLVTWEYPPVVEGGLARHVRGVAEGLAARGDDVHVLTRGGEAEPAQEVRAGVHVHRVAVTAMPYDLDAFLGWVRDMNRAMAAAGRSVRADLVHGHDWLVADAAQRLAAALDVPYLTTIHATEHGRHDGRVGAHPQAHVHAAETRMARGAAHVIVCSAFMRDEVAAVFDPGEDAITVIPNGVDPPRGRPAADAARRERTVLLAGRLVHEKGFDLALDALAHLGGVRCVVAGDGPQRAALEAQSRRLGLQDRVDFLGWAGDESLADLYRAADLCVVPSRYEPFGLVALEAMAAGCPCVVAATGGLREVAPEGVALRLDVPDASALARLVERGLADAQLRARLAAAGRVHARRFSWADVALRTAGVHAALLERLVTVRS